MQWTVVIPAKALPAAKSRLVGASDDLEGHHRLVEAIRADTVSAAREAHGVARVVLVVDTPGPAAAVPEGVDVVVQTTPGLNGAIGDAAAHAVATWPADGVAVLLGDLPALRPEHLAAALSAAARAQRSFVPDASGEGTTLLAAVPGVELDPRFGAGSAARHAGNAHRLDAAAQLRTDVDTAADLAAVVALGVGPRTASVVGRHGEPPAVVHLDVG